MVKTFEFRSRTDGLLLQTTLADEFLADLEELDDDSGEDDAGQDLGDMVPFPHPLPCLKAAHAGCRRAGGRRAGARLAQVSQRQSRTITHWPFNPRHQLRIDAIGCCAREQRTC